MHTPAHKDLGMNASKIYVSCVCVCVRVYLCVCCVCVYVQRYGKGTAWALCSDV